MLKHTKIVATVSDKRCDVEFIDALYKAGMNVVRLNTAHLAEEGLAKIVRYGQPWLRNRSLSRQVTS